MAKRTLDASEFRLPRRLRQAVQDELRSEESVRWVGQPSPWRFAVASAPVVKFSISWTAASVIFLVVVWRLDNPNPGEPVNLLVPWFMLPFLFIGLVTLSCPLLMVCKARKTAYVVTDHRAMTVEVGRYRIVRTFGPYRLRELFLRRRKDGSGDILFQAERRRHHRSRERLNYVGKTNAIGFLGIDKAEHVRGMLAEIGQLAAEQAKPSRSSATLELALDNHIEIAESRLAAIGDRLEGGEAARWLGTPGPFVMGAKVLAAVPFGLHFIGLGVLIASDERASLGADPTFAQSCVCLIPLLPFLLFGLACVCWPFWRMRIARRMAYAVTDRRAVIFEFGSEKRPGGASSVSGASSLQGAALRYHARLQRADGSGDIVFELPNLYTSPGRDLTPGGFTYTDPGLYGVENVSEVGMLVEDAAELRHLPRQVVD